MVNSPLIRPYFLGGVAGTLDSHDNILSVSGISFWGPHKVEFFHKSNVFSQKNGMDKKPMANLVSTIKLVTNSQIVDKKTQLSINVYG